MNNSTNDFLDRIRDALCKHISETPEAFTREHEFNVSYKKEYGTYPGEHKIMLDTYPSIVDPSRLDDKKYRLEAIKSVASAFSMQLNQKFLRYKAHEQTFGINDFDHYYSVVFWVYASEEYNLSLRRNEMDIFVRCQIARKFDIDNPRLLYQNSVYRIDQTLPLLPSPDY